MTCLDPGLSNCTTQIVLVNINGDEIENTNPTQQLGEQIVTFCSQCMSALVSQITPTVAKTSPFFLLFKQQIEAWLQSTNQLDI